MLVIPYHPKCNTNGMLSLLPQHLGTKMSIHDRSVLDGKSKHIDIEQAYAGKDANIQAILNAISSLEFKLGQAPNEDQWLTAEELKFFRSLILDHDKLKALVALDAAHLDTMIKRDKLRRAIAGLMKGWVAWVVAAFSGVVWFWEKIGPLVAKFLGAGGAQ